jgi:hypothetical protein
MEEIEAGEDTILRRVRIPHDDPVSSPIKPAVQPVVQSVPTTLSTDTGGAPVANTEAINQLASAVQGTNPALTPPDLADTELQDIQVTDETLQDPLAVQAQAPEELDAALGTATTVGEDIGQVEAAQVDAAVIGEGAEAEAAQGAAIQRDLERNELVSEQLAELTIGIESGEIPIWARPAVANVDRNLAKRGLSRSSIGQAQLTNAIIQAAMPLAQGNAAALQRRSEINLSNAQQTEMQNLSNRQQAAMQTSMQQQQVLISDQASENAAAHFNASSEQQVEQFNSQMKTSIAQNNAARITTMDQFNAGQTNAMTQFSAQAEMQVDQFNVANATAIAQSNVNWRRQVNTANTTAANTAIMNDVNNRFKLTSQDMANRWQSLRDLANWNNQSIQNGLDRTNKLTLGAMQSEAAKDAAYTEAMGQVIGYGIAGGGGTAGSGTSLLQEGVGVAKDLGGSAWDYITDGSLAGDISAGWDVVTGWFD